MPGSACRRSSASPPTERRSTTSSTVKPRTLLPRPTSSTTVVPEPASSGGSGWRSARHPSTTVTSVPRTLTRPATTGGAPGIRVGTSRGRISRTRSASAAQTRAPTRNSSSRTTPASLIRSEEAKILQGVALSKQSRIGGRFGERRHEVARPFGAHHQPRAGHRMDQREHRRVQQLTRGERVQAPPLPPLDHAREPAVRLVGLGDQEQSRRIAVEPVHNARPPLGGPLRQGGAPSHQHVDERVVPVTGAGMDDQAGGLVEHREVLVFVGKREIAMGGRIAGWGRLVGRELDRHHGPALELRGGTEGSPVAGDVLVGDEAGGGGTRQRKLIGEEAVETLSLGNDDAERDGGHQGSAALASFARSCARPSSQSDTASAIAPTVMAESATLKVGQRALPIPTSTKSTTPRALRTRSITFPTAPAHTSASATMRKRSPGRVASTMDRSTNSATIASAKKIQRE